MKISEEELLYEAGITGFRAEILEKVWQLMVILNGIQDHPFLKERLVLKGGTALNLFFFNLPRLSVDIDLNYIGAIDRQQMLKERPDLEKALESIFLREGFNVRRIPEKHAGGKWQLKYPSALGGNGNLEVDLNFMFRVPLGKITKRHSCRVGTHQTQEIALLDIHELGAGKLAALFGRHASRDLFDAYELLINHSLDFKQLKFFSMIYAAMSGKDWRAVNPNDIHFEKKEVQQQLVPVLRKSTLKENPNLTNHLLDGCRKALQEFFPLQNNEREFFHLLFDHAKIDASLLTSEKELSEKILHHPLLQWKAQMLLKNNQLK